MLEDFKNDAKNRMQKCIVSFLGDLKKLRTGRAHPSLIEHLKVDFYGTESPLNQVANISVEDARTLSITPWDRNMVAAIEKAIITVVREKLKDLAAGKMGYSTSQVGDLVASLI